MRSSKGRSNQAPRRRSLLAHQWDNTANVPLDGSWPARRTSIPAPSAACGISAADTGQTPEDVLTILPRLQPARSGEVEYVRVDRMRKGSGGWSTSLRRERQQLSSLRLRNAIGGSRQVGADQFLKTTTPTHPPHAGRRRQAPEHATAGAVKRNLIFVMEAAAFAAALHWCGMPHSQFQRGVRLYPRMYVC